MHLRLLLILLFTASIQALSQQWTGPVRITGPSTLNGYPDIAVDRAGNIHCVWTQRFDNNYWRIYTAVSTDHGDTWKNYANLSRNTSLWMSEPHIAIDSSDQIHVTYDYNVGGYPQTSVWYTNYDGTAWSQPQCLSDGWPGADHNRLVTTLDGRTICFWYYGTICYREKTKGQWGPVIWPYSGSGDTYFLNNVLVDRYNNLQCFGWHVPDGLPSNRGKLIYLPVIGSQWGSYCEISDTMGWAGDGLVMNENNLPLFAWSQFRTDTNKSIISAFFRRMTPAGLEEKRVITNSPYNQPAISCDDQNLTYIVQCEKVSSNQYDLVCYSNSPDNWNRQVLSSNTLGFFGSRIYRKGTYLFLVTTSQTSDLVLGGDILFFKLNTIAGTHYVRERGNLKVYPNPITQYFSIDGFSSGNRLVSLKLYSYSGMDFTSAISKIEDDINNNQNSISLKLTTDLSGLFFLYVHTRMTEQVVPVIIKASH